MSRYSASPISHSHRRPKIPSATYLLTVCQAINLTAAVVSVTIAAVVGGKLATDATWSTVPYGVQFAAVALAAYPAAHFMRRHGRRKGFVFGAACLIAAGCAGYDAVTTSRFAELILAHGLLGIYVAFANYYRFAAVDSLETDLRPRAVSLVVAGGIVAAFTGPLLSIGLKDIGGYKPFSLCYASFVLLGVGTLMLMAFWKPTSAPSARPLVGSRKFTFSAPIIAAIAASALSYLIMNMLMVQATLVMESLCASFKTSTFAIQGHVVAMFAPSLVSGAILVRAGYRNTLLFGYLLLSCTALLGIWGVSFQAIVIGLLTLGVGWNFGYVGGGALLAHTLTEDNRHRVQGINDSVIAICATIGAFLPAILQSSIGWQNTNLLCLGLCAAGAALTWSCLQDTKHTVEGASQS